jgi:hypothetical protein
MQLPCVHSHQTQRDRQKQHGQQHSSPRLMACWDNKHQEEEDLRQPEEQFIYHTKKSGTT